MAAACAGLNRHQLYPNNCGDSRRPTPSTSAAPLTCAVAEASHENMNVTLAADPPKSLASPEIYLYKRIGKCHDMIATAEQSRRLIDSGAPAPCAKRRRAFLEEISMNVERYSRIAGIDRAIIGVKYLIVSFRLDKPTRSTAMACGCGAPVNSAVKRQYN